MGKQSSFSRQSALDALSELSSASMSNSALQAELKRTRRNVSILVSRLCEANMIIGIMEQVMFALLPPVPEPTPPELPPRPDVVMDLPSHPGRHLHTSPPTAPRALPLTQTRSRPHKAAAFHPTWEAASPPYPAR